MDANTKRNVKARVAQIRQRLDALESNIDGGKSYKSDVEAIGAWLADIAGSEPAKMSTPLDTLDQLKERLAVVQGRIARGEDADAIRAEQNSIREDLAEMAQQGVGLTAARRAELLAMTPLGQAALKGQA